MSETLSPGTSPTLPRLLRPVLDAYRPHADPAIRRNARLLAVFLAVATVFFGTLDAFYTVTIPGYSAPWYGYAFLLAAWVLNRAGRYTAAATLTLAMFPLVTVSLVSTRASADPTTTLSFLVLGLMLASILLSVRGTAVFALASLGGLLLLPRLSPEAVPSLRTIVGPISLTAIAAVLALIFIAHRDGIERERQGELRASEERLRLALDAARMGTWGWNVRTAAVRWSDGLERIFGLPAGGFAGTYEAYLDLVHADDRPAVEEEIRKALAGGTDHIDARHRVVWADGTVRWVEWHGRVDRDSSGRPVRMAGTAFDVTEQKNAEEEREALLRELEAKQAELERFTYAVSHDLKSPLITIRGLLGFVEQDAEAGRTERLRADIGRIATATDRMQLLLDDLLRLSRIGRLENPPDRVAFGEVVREAMAFVQGRLDARGVEVEIAEDVPEVYADRQRLLDVMQNLLENAVKFLGDQPSPRIQVSWRRAPDGGPPVFCVRDNGIGIEPAYHDKVFGVFEKLHAGTEGAGMGLAIVKRILEARGGRIWIESSGEGAGATICFTLPGEPAVAAIAAAGGKR